MDDLDLITEAFCTDPDFFCRIVEQGRVDDALEIICAMVGKYE